MRSTVQGGVIFEEDRLLSINYHHSLGTEAVKKDI